MTSTITRPQARHDASTQAVAVQATSAPSPRRPRRRRPARKGPLVQLTADGVRGLHDHVDRLRTELDGLREWLGEPGRDERLVLDAERLLSDIDRYEGLIAQAEPLDEAAALASEAIVLGSRVGLTFADGSEEVVRIVHPSEAFLDDERISAHSPLAQALLGLSTGDTAEVKAPAGPVRVTVTGIGGLVASPLGVGAA